MRYLPEIAKQFPVSLSIFGLVRTHKAVAASMLASIGLYPGQEILLMQLDAEEGQSQKALCNVLRVDHSTIAKSVSRLEKAGLVSRRKAEHDERVNLITLTSKGDELRKRVVQIWSELETVTISTLSRAEQKSFVTLAEKLAEGLEIHIETAASRKRNT